MQTMLLRTNKNTERTVELDSDDVGLEPKSEPEQENGSQVSFWIVDVESRDADYDSHYDRDESFDVDPSIANISNDFGLFFYQRTFPV